MDEEMRMEILKKILPAIVLPVIVKVLGPIKKIYQKLRAKLTNDFRNYHKHYKERHGQLKVFCVGMQKPIPLDDVYVAVQFLDEERVSKYRSPEDLEKAFRYRRHELNLEVEWFNLDEKQNERQNGMKVANNEQYLMVLGGPGIGKSTFLRKMGFESLKKKRGNFVHECTPVFLELKNYTEAPIDIEALIIDEFKTCGCQYPEQTVTKALKSGKLLILFDGLDEVPTANVDNVVRKIEKFVVQHSQNRFIISCRIAAYTGGFTRFTTVEIADFDNSQIEAYINNWFASTSALKKRQLDAEMKTAEQCWKALNEPQYEATKELVQNPLLLTLLCMVYDDLRYFPRNRADLYEKAFNILLKKWDAEKSVRRDSATNQYLDTFTEKRLLSEIAAKNFVTNRVFLSENELIDQIKEFAKKNTNVPSTFDASKTLKIVVEQGLFVERASGVYSFSHLTFQEYLTANYIVGDTQSIKRLVNQYLHDNRWREVLLLTAGRMYEADKLLLEMAAKVSKSINTNRLKLLLRWAQCITNTPDSPYSGITKRAFAIRQYFSLWKLNRMSERIKHIVSQYPDLDPDFGTNVDLDIRLSTALNCGRNLYQNLDQDLYQNLEFEVEFDRSRFMGSDCNLYTELYFGLDLDLKFSIHAFRDIYQDCYPELYPDLNIYQNLYRYMNTKHYPPFLSGKVNKFNKQLGERITVVERMEQAKIFKGVDLQRMVQKFNEKRKFISAASEGKSVKPPKASIHDTWISVLGITDDMLAISHKEMEDYIQYIRAVELIVKCKEAAGRVTPAIWKQIEDQLLTWDVEDEDIED